MALTAVASILLITFATSSMARIWVVEMVGFGCIPLSLWASSFLLTLRYFPRSVLPHYREWILFGSLVAMTMGSLSLFYPESGRLSEVSLGGIWGTTIGGLPIGLGIGKILALGIVTSVVLFPKRVGLTSLVFFERTGRRLELLTELLTTCFGLFRRQFRTLFSGHEPYSTKPMHSAREERSDNPEIKDTVADSASVVRPDLAIDMFSYESHSHMGPTSELPELSMLTEHADLPADEVELQEMATLIERTLKSHGVNVAIKSISAGPRIVRFGLTPGWLDSNHTEDDANSSDDNKLSRRVRIQSILAREKDIALALKTPSIRIQPSVPGESVVGLEVPIPSPQTVGLRRLIEGSEVRDQSGEIQLPIILGQDIQGNSEILDLSDLPHLLIAGSTGTGKSVCLNAIIASILFTRPPEVVQFLMVDPKGVELTPYDGIAHLMAPVIWETDKFEPALDSLIEIMQERYRRLSGSGVRNIQAYNRQSSNPMPFLVLIVDELAELMLGGGRDAESKLVRLSQMGRASGIHLILSTQRPTVDVVTGLLKANIATRIAFAVPTQTDSRVILDSPGAENLLGKGDMLVLTSASPLPRRVQGTFVEDLELTRVINFWAT